MNDAPMSAYGALGTLASPLVKVRLLNRKRTLGRSDEGFRFCPKCDIHPAQRERQSMPRNGHSQTHLGIAVVNIFR